MKHRILAIALTVITATAAAQTITAVDLKTKPMMLAGEEGVKACGLVFTGVAVEATSPPSGLLLEGSITVNRSLGYLAKAGYVHVSHDMRESPGQKLKWIRVGAAPTLSPINGVVIQGDAPGYWLFGAAADADMSVLRGLVAGDQIWVAFEAAPGAREGRIFSGQLATPLEVAQQVGACLRALAADIRSDDK